MDSNNNISVEVLLKVPFYDLDPLRMVWHGNYFKYFDIARNELYDHRGLDLDGFYDKTKILFPISKTATKHIFPLRGKDDFICKATLAGADIKIVINYEIRLASNGKVCVKGSTEQVAVQSPGMDLLLKIPDEIRETLGF